MRFGDWALRWLAVDGVLPLATFVFPRFVAWLAPGNEDRKVAVFFLMPTSIAYWRARRATRQIAAISGTSAKWPRQTLFGMAIVLLMAFDYLSCMIAFVKPDPNGDLLARMGEVPWYLPVGIVAAYLALTAAALWPAGGFARPHADSFELE